MDNFCAVLFLLIVTNVNVLRAGEDNHINQLVKQWAPLIWMSPEEKYFPLSVEKFFQNVHLSSENGKSIDAINENNFPETDTKSLFLVSNENLDNLLKENSSFLNGENPKHYPVPVYAIITSCSQYKSFHSSNSSNIRNDIRALFGRSEPNFNFHVTYWIFYPYNKGKEMCFLGKVPSFSFFGRCFGHLKSIGNHMGDWERMSLLFTGNSFPSEMYIATHHLGGYYKFDRYKRIFKYDSKRTKTRMLPVPKFPLIVRTQGGHPVLFAAEGSHGLWSAPGEHRYNTIPPLTDKCGYGDPWKTWNSIKIFNFDISKVPDWISYRGRWGNPKTNCVLFKKLGLCEYTDGPPGLLRRKRDFYCCLCKYSYNKT